MIKTVKVQHNNQNTSVNIPKEIREIFKIEKGETVLIETVSDREIVIKKI